MKEENQPVLNFWDKKYTKMRTNKGIIICGIAGFSKSYFEILQKQKEQKYKKRRRIKWKNVLMKIK
jgi:hypothetical protein